jgi:hypothetical protein
LARLRNGGNTISSVNLKKEEDDIFGEDEDFDAEAFFGVKEENLNDNMGGIDDDLM